MTRPEKYTLYISPQSIVKSCFLANGHPRTHLIICWAKSKAKEIFYRNNHFYFLGGTFLFFFFTFVLHIFSPIKGLLLDNFILYL